MSRRIETQIVEYLAANPAAQDTVRGIIEWWLLKQKLVQTTADVETALSHLVKSGKVNARKGADGQLHYSVNGKRK